MQESNELTKDALIMALPKRMKSTISDELVDSLNGIINEPNIRDSFRDNMIGFASVIQEGRFRLEAYVSAVRYVTYKLYGDTNLLAFTKTFPIRYQDMVNKGYADKDIGSAVSAYNKTKLVIKVYELTLIPCHLLNADIHQKAVNHLAHLMINARSEKVQCDSASKLVDVLKLPETLKVEVDVGLKEDSAIKDLRRTTLDLMEQQKKMIVANVMDVKGVAESKLVIEGEFKEEG